MKKLKMGLFLSLPEEVAKDAMERIDKIAEQSKAEERERILNFLKENGHGGGNWRRLIEQLLNGS